MKHTWHTYSVSVHLSLISYKSCIFPLRYKEAVLLELGSSQDNLKVANQIQDWFSNFSHMKCQKSWHEISVKGNFAQKPCDGNQLLNWRNKGFKTILDVLVVSSKKPHVIRLI